jgi:hypothetical protein
MNEYERILYHAKNKEAVLSEQNALPDLLAVKDGLGKIFVILLAGQTPTQVEATTKTCDELRGMLSDLAHKYSNDAVRLALYSAIINEVSEIIKFVERS